MTEVGRDLRRSSSPTPFPSPSPSSEQGQLEQVAQDHVQLDFECLEGWRLHCICLLMIQIVLLTRLTLALYHKYVHHHTLRKSVVCHSGLYQKEHHLFKEPVLETRGQKLLIAAII